MTLNAGLEDQWGLVSRAAAPVYFVLLRGQSSHSSLPLTLSRVLRLQTAFFF